MLNETKKDETPTQEEFEINLRMAFDSDEEYNEYLAEQEREMLAERERWSNLTPEEQELELVRDVYIDMVIAREEDGREHFPVDYWDKNKHILVKLDDWRIAAGLDPLPEDKK